MENINMQNKFDRHFKTMIKLRNRLEAAYENCADSKKKEELLWKLVDYRFIKSTDSRLVGLSTYSRRKRDARKSKMLAYIAKCPYLKYEENIEVPVTIQPHDGVRSYKETVWHVKYPSSKTYVKLEELSTVTGVKEIKDNIQKIVSQQGCEWEDIRDEKFYKAVMNGNYLVYKVMFKNLTNTLFDFCGYVFVEKLHGTDNDVIVTPIINNQILSEKFVLPNVATDDIVNAVKNSIDKAYKKSIRDKEEALRLKAEAEEKQREAEEKKASKGRKSKQDKSAEDMAAEADKLREALGILA